MHNSADCISGSCARGCTVHVRKKREPNGAGKAKLSLILASRIDDVIDDVDEDFPCLKGIHTEGEYGVLAI